MSTLDELINHKAVIALNIIKGFEQPVDETPVFSEEDFVKAQEEGLIEVFEVDAVSAFSRKIQKALGENPDANGLLEIEKAKRDLSKLVKVQKRDSKGRNMTYYVRATDKAKQEHKVGDKVSHDNEDAGQTHHGVIKQKFDDGEHKGKYLVEWEGGAGSIHDGKELKKKKPLTPEQVGKKMAATEKDKHYILHHNDGSKIVVKRFGHGASGEPNFLPVNEHGEHQGDKAHSFPSGHIVDVEPHTEMDKKVSEAKDEKKRKFQENAKKTGDKTEAKTHPDLGKVFPLDWDGPSLVKVESVDERGRINVVRVDKKTKEPLSGVANKNRFSPDEWEDEKSDGEKLHKQDSSAFEPAPDYSHIQEWVGDVYSDEEIHSVYGMFGGEEKMNKKFKYAAANNRTQAAENAHIEKVITEYMAHSHSRPSGMTGGDLREILWGIGMNAQNPVKK